LNLPEDALHARAGRPRPAHGDAQPGPGGASGAETVVEDLSRTHVPARIARNTAVQLLGRAVAYVIAFASLIVLTRYLGVEGTGNYLLVRSFLATLNTSELGLFQITVRELTAGRVKADILLGNMFVIRLGQGVFSVLLVSGAALLLHYPAEVTSAICLASLSFLFVCIAQTLSPVLGVNLRMEYQEMGNVAGGLTFVGLIVVIVTQDMGLIALIVAYDVSVLVNAGVVFVSSLRFVKPRFTIDWQLCKHLVRESLPLGLAMLLFMAYNRVDIIILSKLEGADAVGLYGVAYRFVDMAIVFSAAFVISIYPMLSRYYGAGDIQRLRSLLQKSLNLLFLSTLAGAAVLFVFAEEVLRLIAFDDFTEAATALRILSVALVLLCVDSALGHAVLAVGRQGTLFWITLTGLLVNVAANFLLIPRFGFDGAAIATLATEVVVFGLLMTVVARGFGFVPSLVPAVKAAMVAAAAVAVAMYVAPDNLLPRAGTLALVLGAGLALSRVVTLGEIRSLFRPAGVEAERRARGRASA